MPEAISPDKGPSQKGAFAFAAMFVFACACSSAETGPILKLKKQPGNHSSVSEVYSDSGVDGDTRNKPQDDKRPSEQGEGVEGFLTDPSLLVVNEIEGSIVVTAKPGAIAPLTGEASALTLKVYPLSHDLLRATCRDAALKTEVTDAALASSSVASDGSVQLSITRNERSPLLFVVSSGRASIVKIAQGARHQAVKLVDDSGPAQRIDTSESSACQRYQGGDGLPILAGVRNGKVTEFPSKVDSTTKTFVPGSTSKLDANRWIGHSVCPNCIPQERAQRFALSGLDPAAKYKLTVYPVTASSVAAFTAKIVAGGGTIESGATRRFSEDTSLVGTYWVVTFVPSSANLEIELSGSVRSGYNYLYVDAYGIKRAD